MQYSLYDPVRHPELLSPDPRYAILLVVTAWARDSSGAVMNGVKDVAIEVYFAGPDGRPRGLPPGVDPKYIRSYATPLSVVSQWLVQGGP